MAIKSYKGMFNPKNPKKYIGNAGKIVFRSMLEYNFMKYCDLNDNILEWKSEEFFIPYLSPLDNKVHRYFPDIWIKCRTKTGEIKEILIEIKPFSQTYEPKQNKKKTKTHVAALCEYAKNKAKWEYAEKWCEKNNMEFKILTEKEIKPSFPARHK